MTISKNALIERVHMKSNLPVADIEMVLDLLMGEVGAGIAQGQRVSLAEYGIFIPRAERERSSGRDGDTRWWSTEPRFTGRTTAIFKPGRSFRALMNPNEIADSEEDATAIRKSRRYTASGAE